MGHKVIVFGVDGLMMPLVKKFAAEGELPHISRMLSEGAATELLPYISAWGDVNWAAFLSGQAPGTSWRGQALPADYARTRPLLKRLEESGLRAALVHFPESVASPAPHFTLSPYWSAAAPSPYTFAAPAIFTTDRQRLDVPPKPRQQTLGWPPSSPLAYHDKGLWQPLEREVNGEYRLTIRSPHGDNVTLSLDIDTLTLRSAHGGVTLVQGAWSDWLALGEVAQGGKARFWLAHVTPYIELIQSEVTFPQRIARDSVLAQMLFEDLGPFYSQWAVKASPDEALLASTFQDAEHQSLWLADSALRLTHQHGYSLWAGVHHLIDESHHLCLGQYDPDSPFYDPQQAARYEAVIRECYKILDRSLGRIINGMDKETTLFLASDHGAVPNHFMCDIQRYLAKHGLVALDNQGQIIRSQSLVYLKDERGGLEIYINLQGREPDGTVPLADYACLQARLLHLLRNWHIEHNGKVHHAVAWALRKEDAASAGYWGEYAGDVLFTYDSGFVWGTSASGEDICPVVAPGANHGPQKPTARTAHTSNYGVLLAFGAGIRRGYYHDHHHHGPYRMADPGATIAWLLGVKRDTLDGSVMQALLAPDETDI
ncbi:alkaline phosphatase family protein [Phytobacter palmae]|uniref:Alkaline phosphatase family protein n=1 Tax=Phytobacter palmae TaxID=1855371 RepID=A0ABU9VA56_9ENTR